MDTLIQWLQVLIEWVKCIPTAFYCAFTAFANFMIDLLLYIPKQIYALMAKALAAFIALIPVPDFIMEMQSKFSEASAIAGYFFNLMKLDYGLKVVLSAYVFRFVLRRIPGIG